jgi:predicted transcriptional regulator
LLLQVDKASSNEISSNKMSDDQILEIHERAVVEYLSEKLPDRNLTTNMNEEETKKALDDIRELLIKQQADNSFKTMGRIPSSFTSETGKGSWYKKLEDFAGPIRLNSELYYPNGPIFSHGVEITGYFVIELAEDKKEMVDEAFLNELYNKLQKKATSTGIDELPVLFRWSATETELHGYDSTYTYIPGGGQWHTTYYGLHVGGVLSPITNSDGGILTDNGVAT